MLAKPKASPRAIGEGKRIRRARNIVKRFRHAYDRGDIYLPGGKREAHWVSRYRRACSVLMRDALLNV